MRAVRPAPPEGAFAVAMATAIVARAVHASLPAVSRTLVWLSLAALVAVAILLVAARPRRSGWWDAATFAAAAAATGAGLGAEGWATAALALAGAAVAGWAGLLALPAPWRGGRADAAAASGRRLLAVVATQSAVIAAAALARSWHTSALAGIAVAAWVAAVVVYSAMIGPVARGLVARARASEFRADDWIAMGALAISALAAAQLLHLPGVPLHPAVLVAAVAVWSAAWLWVPTLVRLDVRAAAAPGRRWPGAERWSMVFPIGMLSAASQALGSAGSLPAFARLGRDTAWIALAAWAAVAAGAPAGQAWRRYASRGGCAGFAAVSARRSDAQGPRVSHGPTSSRPSVRSRTSWPRT